MATGTGGAQAHHQDSRDSPRVKPPSNDDEPADQSDTASQHTIPRAPQPQLRFNKDFDKPADATILQASDGTCFRFELGALAVASTFFANKSSLPTVDTDQGPLIRLASAKPKGLHFALSVIKTTLQAVVPPSFCIDEDLCDDVLEIATTYNLPILFPLLLKATECVRCVQPSTRLVIAILARDKKAVDELALISLKEHQGYRTSLVNALRAREPRAFVPQTLVRLLSHHTRLHGGLHALEEAATQHAVRAFGNMFHMECRLQDHPCPEFRRWRGDFTDYVSFEAALCRKRLANNPQLIARGNKSYNPDTSCEDCAHRLIRVMDHAFDEALPRSAYTLDLDL